MDDLFTLTFGIYIALAFVIYAIRRALKLPKRFLPILAIVLGIFFSCFQDEKINFDTTLRGIEYAIYGVGLVETMKSLFLKNGE